MIMVKWCFKTRKSEKLKSGFSKLLKTPFFPRLHSKYFCSSEEKILLRRVEYDTSQTKKFTDL